MIDVLNAGSGAPAEPDKSRAILPRTFDYGFAPD